MKNSARHAAGPGAFASHFFSKNPLTGWNVHVNKASVSIIRSKYFLTAINPSDKPPAMKNPFKISMKKLAQFIALIASCLAATSLSVEAAGPYYWDNDGATAGFGNATGTWAAPTTGNATQGWSTDPTGATLPVNQTTATTDAVNFGNGATGLGAGTITVSGTVNSGNMTFASGSGAIVLSGGTAINLAAATTITLDNAADTISTSLTGAATSLTKAGTGTLTLGGNNLYAGNTTVSVGTLKAGSTTGLSANSAFSVATGAFLDLSGFNNTIKSLSTATGTITNSSGAATLKFASTGATAQLFTGSLGLQVSGAQNTDFTNGNNTYSGGTLVGFNNGTNNRILLSGRTLGVGTPGALTNGEFGTGAITLGVSATDRAQIYMAGTNTINNAIVVNTALGNTDNAGAFQIRATGQTINGAINANLADVTFQTASGTGGITLNGAISGNSGLTLLAGSAGATLLTVTLTNNGTANSYAGNTTISSVKETLTLGAANQLPNGAGKGNLIVTGGNFKMGGFSETINGLSGNGTVDGISGTPTLTVGDNDQTSTFSGVIKNTAGTLAVTKIGAGTLTLSGTNTYSGATAVNAGLLVFQNTGAKAAGTVTTISAGGIGLGVGAVSGDYSDAHVAALFNTNTLTGFNLVSGSGVALDTTAGNFTQSTALTAARALTKLGSNTLTLSGTNTYNGTTTISAGTLKAGSAAGFSPNSAISVASGATLDLGGFNYTMASSGLSAIAGTVTDSSAPGSGGRLIISTALPGVATPQLFTGSLGLQIFGGGNTAILGNANSTYSGGTIFGANSTTATRFLGSGTIGTGTPGALTSGIFGTGTITMGLATTDKAQFYASGALTINNALIVNTNIGDGTAGTFRLESGPLTINGAVNANLADVSFTAWNATGARQATVTGAISGTSGVQVSAPGVGPLQINLTLNNAGGANSYAGNTTITSSGSNSATLTLGAANQIPNGAGKGNLIITGGNFNMGGFSETINGLSGNGTVDGISGTPTLTVGDGNATSTFSGVIKNTAGTLAVTKIGTGTLTLSGNNTYTGATLVTTGTLVVNGSLGSGGVTVQTGATLGGNITAGGTTTIDGTLNVGNSPGTGSFSTLSLAGTTVMEFNANPSRGSAGIAYDTIGVSSVLTYGGDLKLTFSGTVTNDAGIPFTLFTGFTSQSANFAHVYIYAGATQKGFLTNTLGVWTGLADLGYGDNQQSFTFTQASGNLIVAVPEPSTWALLAFSLTTVMVLRRRRQS
jgi:autotransporter-associated beta strand protein